MNPYIAAPSANPYIGVGSDAAVQHAECPVCFEPLCDAPQAVFMNGHKRACRHFFHQQCVSILAQRSCPMCRCDFQETVVVPPPDADPDLWFRLVDCDGNGQLDKNEVKWCVKGSLQVDERSSDQFVDQNWKTWDPNGDGVITRDEMAHVIHDAKEKCKQKSKHQAPKLSSNREAWFQYWDMDGSESLSTSEVARAIVHTTRQFMAPGQAPSPQETQEALQAVWCIFDTDGSGFVDKREFKQSDGLGDTLAASVRGV